MSSRMVGTGLADDARCERAASSSIDAPRPARRAADDVVVEDHRAGVRPHVRHGPPAVQAAAHPQHEVGEGQVGDQLPVADEQVQPLRLGGLEVVVSRSISARVLTREPRSRPEPDAGRPPRDVEPTANPVRGRRCAREWTRGRVSCGADPDDRAQGAQRHRQGRDVRVVEPLGSPPARSCCAAPSPCWPSPTPPTAPPARRRPSPTSMTERVSDSSTAYRSSRSAPRARASQRSSRGSAVIRAEHRVDAEPLGERSSTAAPPRSASRPVVGRRSRRCRAARTQSSREAARSASSSGTPALASSAALRSSAALLRARAAASGTCGAQVAHDAGEPLDLGADVERRRPGGEEPARRPVEQAADLEVERGLGRGRHDVVERLDLGARSRPGRRPRGRPRTPGRPARASPRSPPRPGRRR